MFCGPRDVKDLSRRRITSEIKTCFLSSCDSIVGVLSRHFPVGADRCRNGAVTRSGQTWPRRRHGLFNKTTASPKKNRPSRSAASDTLLLSPSRRPRLRYFFDTRRENSQLERDKIFAAVENKKQKRRREREGSGPKRRRTWRLCSDAELRVIRGIATADLPPPSDPSCISRSGRACRRRGPFSPSLSGGGAISQFSAGRRRRQRCNVCSVNKTTSALSSTEPLSPPTAFSGKSSNLDVSPRPHRSHTHGDEVRAQQE